MGLLFALLYVPLVLLVVFSGFTMLYDSSSPGNEAAYALSLLMFVAGILLLLLLSMVQAAITGIYGAALYRYSTGDEDGGNAGGGEFSPEMMGAAFAAK